MGGPGAQGWGSGAERPATWALHRPHFAERDCFLEARARAVSPNLIRHILTENEPPASTLLLPIFFFFFFWDRVDTTVQPEAAVCVWWLRSRRAWDLAPRLMANPLGDETGKNVFEEILPPPDSFGGSQPLRRLGQRDPHERPATVPAGSPSWASSLASSSDVFPGWSSCSDETDDFPGPLLLTAGRSRSD